MTERNYNIRPRSAASMLSQEKAPIEKPVNKLRLGLPRERYIVVAGGLAAVFMVGGTGQFMADDPMHLPMGLTEMMMDFDCMEVSTLAKIRVEKALNSPNDPELIDLLLNAPDLNVPIFDVPGFKQFQMKRANELGLSILDPKESITNLERADSRSEILTGLNNFSEEYGFKFEIFEDGNFRSLRDFEQNFIGIKEDELSNEDLKLISLETVKVLSDVPVELGRLSHMHRILIVKNLDTQYIDVRKRSIGIANPIYKSIYLDYKDLFNTEGIRSLIHHEIGHGIDATICGNSGFERDRDYDSLNEDGFSYDEDYLNAQDITGVISRYGIKNMLEDKAENFERMIGGLIDVNSLEDEVKSKYILQLVRLEDNIPGIADYLRSVSIIS